MKIVISPAKTLDYETPWNVPETTLPRLPEQSAELVDILRQKAPWEISALMGISDKLGELNAERFQNWQWPFPDGAAKPAILAFKGDVYTGLEAETLSEEALLRAQKQLRILSGLYGILSPLDLMLPYRLEMGTKLENPKGKTLYAFWGETLTELLRQDMAEDGDEVLVNLASNEYFKALKPNKLGVRVVTPVFKDLKGGQYKIVSFWAKKARGMMTRFIIENDIRDAEALRDFDVGGYRYNPAMSEADTLTFTRDTPE
ncbi:MAG: peroxide stress protein YaaA [Gammaproteobacteria bacterium]|nr:MAG: peroxide stress protein YaaA [Gammaproteobacteria bacterium]